MAIPLFRRAAQIRALGIELIILAGHLMLYPTGVAQERARTKVQAQIEKHAQSNHNGHGGHGQSPHQDRYEHPGPLERDSHESGAHRFAPTSAHLPVLLLHGFVDNRSVFTLLRRSLARHGWRHVHALNYSPLTCDVRQAAILLGRHVEQLCEQTGQSRIDIVGHSLGGLIARYYVQRLGGDARIRTVVTLGTPHQGTRVGPLLNPHPIVRQMRPGSSLLNELAAPAPGCTTRFVAFWSDLDQIMSPVETARLDHPDLDATNILVPGVGHLTLPVHGEVAAGIRQVLAEGHQGADDVEAA